ncbi:MAG: hypothetical protein JO317_09400 [Verrucomicrobiae bacterium]|nr:hypothetical protein [Verrucomicrobiae bacterium]
MRARPIHFILLAVGLLLAGCARNERSAFRAARRVVPDEWRHHVLLVVGRGDAANIRTWTFTFYNPTSASRAEAVRVEQGKVTDHRDAQRAVADDAWSFDPELSKVKASEALATARDYAQKNQIAFNQSTLMLRRASAGTAPAWVVEMRDGDTLKGYVKTKAEDGTFLAYQPPEPELARAVREFFQGLFGGGPMPEDDPPPPPP